eukprot:CFRG2716T1
MLLNDEDIVELERKFGHGLTRADIVQRLSSVDGLKQLSQAQLRDTVKVLQYRLQRTILLSGKKNVLVQRIARLLLNKPSSDVDSSSINAVVSTGEGTVPCTAQATLVLKNLNDTVARLPIQVSTTGNDDHGEVKGTEPATVPLCSPLQHHLDTTRSPLCVQLGVVALIPFGCGVSDGGCTRGAFELPSLHQGDDKLHVSSARFHARLIPPHTSKSSDYCQPRWSDGFRLFIHGEEVPHPKTMPSKSRKRKAKDSDGEKRSVTCETLDITSFVQQSHIHTNHSSTNTSPDKMSSAKSDTEGYEIGAGDADCVEVEFYQPVHRVTLSTTVKDFALETGGHLLIEAVRERTDTELRDLLTAQTFSRDSYPGKQIAHTPTNGASGFDNDGCEMIATNTPLTGTSLTKCAITFKQMTVPVKGKNCAHTQFFDLKVYVRLCTRLGLWECAVCMSPCPFEDLRIGANVFALLNPNMIDKDDCDVKQLNQSLNDTNASMANNAMVVIDDD